MSKKYVIAFDQGTTSTRAILFNSKGEIVQMAHKKLKQYHPQSGWVEYDALQIYQDQKAVFEEVLTKASVELSEIASVGIANQRETVVVWNKVDKTVMDLRKSAVLSDKLNKIEGGFDHNFVLNDRTVDKAAAVLASPQSNVSLHLYCTQPGLQFFSAADIGEWDGKYGVITAHAPALCLEAQHFPDTPHHDHFPSTVLEPGAIYEQEIKYQFKI